MICGKARALLKLALSNMKLGRSTNFSQHFGPF